MSHESIAKASPESHGLTGKYRVRVIRPLLREATRLCPNVRDFMELRSHCLKLRWWPEHEHTYSNGHVLDLDWEWIKALNGLQVGELRLDDEIGGHKNMRAIFFVGDPEVKLPLPMIWILAVLDKKRQDFTRAQIDIFRSRRILVVERFYRRREFA